MGKHLANPIFSEIRGSSGCRGGGEEQYKVRRCVNIYVLLGSKEDILKKYHDFLNCNQTILI